MPFTESRPKGWLGEYIQKLGYKINYSMGPSAVVFDGKLKTTSMICYEECFGDRMREGVLKGAKLLIGISDSAWFSPSRLPLVQFYQARLRAVESGIPLIRATNSGITAFVNSFGEIKAKIGDINYQTQFESGILQASFVPYSYPTLYLKFGDSIMYWLSGLGLISYLGFSLISLKKNTKSLSKKPSTCVF